MCNVNDVNYDPNIIILRDVIILIGPPLSGKGTQGKLIENKYLDYVHISTGNLLRSSGDLSGKYVDDKFIIKLLDKEILKFDRKQKFILDGVPRTIEQFKMIIKRFNIKKIFYLNLSEEIIILRNKSREESTSRKDIRIIEARIRDYNKLTLPLINFLKNKYQLENNLNNSDLYALNDILELIEIDGKNEIQYIFKIISENIIY